MWYVLLIHKERSLLANRISRFRRDVRSSLLASVCRVETSLTSLVHDVALLFFRLEVISSLANFQRVELIPASFVFRLKLHI
jgi:hypothetical protein